MPAEVAVHWEFTTVKPDRVEGTVTVADRFNICAVAHTKDEANHNATEVTLHLSAPAGGFPPFDGTQKCECAYSAISPPNPLPKQTTWKFVATSKAFNAKPRWIRVLVTAPDGLD